MESVIVFAARDLFVLVILLWVLTFFLITRAKRVEFVVALIAAAVVAVLLDKIAGWLYFNPRPFTSGDVKPLIVHSADNGFPSGHTLLVMTLTTLIYFYYRRLAAVTLILALLVGAGRVWAHVHSWVDILGAVAIGVIAGYAGVKIARYLAPRLSARRPAEHRLSEEPPKNNQR